MHENRSRFVHLCQQVLAFGTVLAVVAPAASIVSLDIVAPAPATGRGSSSPTGTTGSLVASRPVEPEVTEYAVRGVEADGIEALTGKPRAQQLAADDLAALSAPEPVSGYATVGVTWKAGAVEDDHDISVSVRSLKDGVWSGWEQMEYHEEHGPDPDSLEARNARPGTDPVIVGDVDEVQVKAVTESGEAPTDMKVAVVDPGVTVGARVEEPAIDTAALLSAQPTADEGAVLAGTAADVTPKPQIYSRAQWGADERMRSKSSLKYYEVHAGFVHHTVNANSYTRAQVPALLRGIYAYHTQSKGWSDIGYNFIVDRFGRIWEGRYGGVDRPVVGAHTLGYNEYSFAMSALGNFDTARPSSAMVDAYGRLFAWKLSLHGVDAASASQRVGSRTFRAINGHRDAGQTACPGRYLYAKLSTIRALAARYQRPFTSRQKSTNLSGSRWPDLVVREKTTQRALVVRTGGQVDFGRGVPAPRRWGGLDLVTASRDLTGDGLPDMVGRNRATTNASIYPGDGQGRFAPATTVTTRFATADQLTAVMDMTGDGRNDLVARVASNKNLYLHPGLANGKFGKRRLLSADWGRYNLTAGVGDLSGDRKNDIVARDSEGTLWLWRGNGRGGLAGATALPGRWRTFDIIAGLGDATNDGRPDVIVRSRKSQLTFIYPGDGRGGFRHRFGAFDRFKGVNFLANIGQVSGNRRADLVGRDSRGRLMVFANTGRRNLGSTVDTGSVFTDTDLILSVGDWNGDRLGDLMTRSQATGEMFFRAGLGGSSFAAPVRAGRGWGSVNLVAAVGDVTGDGYPDLMGQPRGGAMRIYPSNGSSGFRRSYVAHSAISSNDQMGVGLWNSDGAPDSILRRSDGSLVLYRGNGPGGLLGGTKIAAGAGRYDWLQGVGDADGDGFSDLVGRERSTGTLWLLPGSGSGLGPRRFIAEGFERFDLSS